MRKIFGVGLMLLAAGCATAPLVPVETTGSAKPRSAEPVTVPEQEPIPNAAPVTTAPVEPTSPPVTRKHVSLDDFAQVNDDRLLQVYVGMSLRSVERIMDGQQSGLYINPYRRQMLTGVDGKISEVLFYLTRPPRAGRRITESYLTPVIFQENRVVAIGRYPLKKLRRSLCQQRAPGTCP